MIYCIGGVDLCVECENAQKQDCIHSLWKTFFHVTHAENPMRQGSGLLRFASHPLPQPVVAYPLSQIYELKLWRTPSGYHLDCGASALALDTTLGEGTAYLSSDFWQRPLLQKRQFFQTALVTLLHGVGGYYLHANCMVWGRDGVLAVGRSGSGKSTLTLGLIHANWRCSGDDALLLRTMGDSVRAHALRRGFACTAQTTIQFPALADALMTAPSLSDHKKLLDLESLWPDCFTPSCTPRLIVFPEITDAPHSRLIPLNPIQTLCALLKQSITIQMDATNAGRHLAMLSQLTRQARGYHLYAGRDVYAEPERVATLLRAALEDG